MTAKQAKYRFVDELQARFDTQKSAIRRRLNDFASIQIDEYFYELVYCLLTPQSSAINAGKAVQTLKAADLLSQKVDATSLLRQKNSYIRFHNTKARHLSAAKAQFPEIAAQLFNGLTSVQLRKWLVDNVKGLGWKEASHFLRNIGHRNLAILDRHILRNLKRHTVIHRIPKSLTPRRYLTIETQFATFAAHIGTSMDELDLLFWSEETGEILK